MNEQNPTEKETVAVCDACLTASCWNGVFMCQNSETAGTVEKTIAELEELGLEHPENWLSERKHKQGGEKV